MKRNFLCVLFVFLFLGLVLAQEKDTSLITNSFFETDIREALRDISAQTGVWIIPDETVQGIISIELKEVTLETTLKMILSPGGYCFRKMPEGYYLIGSAKPTSPSFNLLTQTEYIKPSYIKARDVFKLISSFFEPYMQINDESNSLTITASPEIIRRFKQDLAKIDLPPQQIMIEALVVELSEEGKKSLGINWGSMSEGGFSIYPPADLSYDRIAGKGSFTISGTFAYDLLMRINTLALDGKAKIRANPRIATLEGREAQIYVGKEEWYLINVGSGSQAYYTLQSIPTGVILKITPYLTQNDQITVEISPEVSEVTGKGATNLPVITKRTAKTIVRVDNGQTIAIGGLIQEQSIETETKVPFLSSIPVMGNLFRHKKTTTENKEVIIFITPRILNEGNKSAEDKRIVLNEEGYEHVEKKQRNTSFLKKEDKIKNYYSQIMRIIQMNKKFPDQLSLEMPREVIVKFTLFSNGAVDEVELFKSSRNPYLDSITVRLIKDLSPFPPFPKGIKRSRIAFVLPVGYEP